MKYFKHFEMIDGTKVIKCYKSAAEDIPWNIEICIPEDPGNSDYARMMEEVEAGTSTIEEIDDTPE